MRFFFCFCVIIISGLAAPTAQAVTAPSAAPAQPCVPAPREIRGDGVDNDCDNVIDERLTAAQLASLVDDEVKDCDCKDPATVAGQQARALALDGLRAANRLGPSVDPASIELLPPECVEMKLAGYEWDGSGWATAGSASRTARAAMAKADAAQKTADEAKKAADGKLDKADWEKYLAEQKANEAAADAEEEEYRNGMATAQRFQDQRIGAVENTVFGIDGDDTHPGVPGLVDEVEDLTDGMDGLNQRVSDNETAIASLGKTEVGAVVFLGSQSPVTVDGEEVVGSGRAGLGLTIGWEGHPFQNSLTAGARIVGLVTRAGDYPGLQGLGFVEIGRKPIESDFGFFGGLGYSAYATAAGGRTSLTGGHGVAIEGGVEWRWLSAALVLAPSEKTGVRVDGEELSIPTSSGGLLVGAGFRF